MKKLVILPALLLFMGNATFAAEIQTPELSKISIENTQANEKIDNDTLENLEGENTVSDTNESQNENDSEDNFDENAQDGQIIQNFYYGEQGDSDHHGEREDKHGEREDKENDNEEEMIAIGGVSGAAGIILGALGMWIFNRRKQK